MHYLLLHLVILEKIGISIGKWFIKYFYVINLWLYLAINGIINHFWFQMVSLWKFLRV